MRNVPTLHPLHRDIDDLAVIIPKKLTKSGARISDPPPPPPTLRQACTNRENYFVIIFTTLYHAESSARTYRTELRGSTVSLSIIRHGKCSVIELGSDQAQRARSERSHPCGLIPRFIITKYG